MSTAASVSAVADPIQLLSAAKAHKGLAHQIAAWRWLQEQQSPEVLEEFAELFRADPPAKEPSPSPGRPASSVALTVPYEYQLDNSSGQGQRECFSSSCAMVARFYGKVRNDDEYNRIRAQFGDTTDSGAHLRALAHIGLIASFHQDGTAETLERLLRDGRPVPVGWLHRGNVTKPSGGGHWTVVVGFDAEAFLHHDPNGEADLVNGGYVSNKATAGRNIRYSRRNWLRRWEVDGRGSGWYLDIRA